MQRTGALQEVAEAPKRMTATEDQVLHMGLGEGSQAEPEPAQCIPVVRFFMPRIQDAFLMDLKYFSAAPIS